MDRCWWDTYIKDAAANFKGRLYTSWAGIYGLPTTGAHHYKNSGAGAIAFAAAKGAKRIILLGYDCGFADGKKHWHGDHPPQLKNAGTVRDWPQQFAQLARDLAMNNGPHIINASRRTALQCFERQPLEDALVD